MHRPNALRTVWSVAALHSIPLGCSPGSDPYTGEIVEDVGGFGVRSKWLHPGDCWRLRLSNELSGHQTYAPSPVFRVGGQWYDLRGGSDALVEYRPWGDDELRITGARTAQLHPIAAPSAGRSYDNHRGLWLSENWPQFDAEDVLRGLDEALALGGFNRRLIDFGWSTNRTLLEPDDSPRIQTTRLLREHRDAGMPCILWISPYVPVDTAAWTEAARCGWFVRDAKGEISTFPVVGSGEVIGSYLDFTHPDLLQHWQRQLEQLMQAGAIGVKLDFGEALPDRVTFHLPGVDRQEYIELTQAATSSVIDRFGGVVIVRAGWRRSPDLVGLWTGDHNASTSRFGGVVSACQRLASAHEAGWRFSGFDIGGYFGTPTSREMGAWQQLAQLSDFGVYHAAGERHPARLGATEGHTLAVKIRAAISDADPDFYPTATWRRGILESGWWFQRETPSVIVGVAGGRVAFPVILPEGRWQHVDGSIFSGGQVLHATGDLARAPVFTAAQT